MSVFKSYKPGQARLSRMVALLSGLFLIAWGCRSLMMLVGDPTKWPKGGKAINIAFLAPEDAAGVAPWHVDAVVFNGDVSIAFLISAVLLVTLSFWYWRFLNKERWADLLIDMETELRKVSWPTPSDAWQSTLVVTGFTATVVVTILFYDLVISGFIKLFVNS